MGHSIERQSTALRGFEAVRIVTDREAYAHSERRFTRLLGFRFTSDEAPMMVSSGPRFRDWSLALVKSTGHRIELGDENKYSLLFPYRGRIAVRRGGAEAELDAGGMLVVAPGRRTTTLSSDYLGILIQVPVQVFEAVRVPSRGRQRAPSLTALSAEYPAALAALDTIRCLEASATKLNSERAWRDLIAPIVGAIGGGRELTSPVARRHVEIAEDFMQGNLHRALSVAEIAEACAVTPRSLQMAFKLLRRASPMEALRTLRLRRARELLEAPREMQSVTQVATGCGFEHLGRFSACYRQAYGENPLSTYQRKRLRNLPRGREKA